MSNIFEDYTDVYDEADLYQDLLKLATNENSVFKELQLLAGHMKKLLITDESEYLTHLYYMFQYGNLPYLAQVVETHDTDEVIGYIMHNDILNDYEDNKGTLPEDMVSQIGSLITYIDTTPKTVIMEESYLESYTLLKAKYLKSVNSSTPTTDKEYRAFWEVAHSIAGIALEIFFHEEVSPYLPSYEKMAFDFDYLTNCLGDYFVVMENSGLVGGKLYE